MRSFSFAVCPVSLVACAAEIRVFGRRGKLVADWKKAWPFQNYAGSITRGSRRTRNVSRLIRRDLKFAHRVNGMKTGTLQSIGSVARKEFIHILRDWRILILIFTLPPAFTLLLGHAFEVTELTDAPTLLIDADRSDESAKLLDQLRASKTFAWH
jgi:hypothetical protein